MTVNISLTSECVFLQHPPALLDLVWPSRTGDGTWYDGAILGYPSASSYFDAITWCGHDVELQNGWDQLTFEAEESTNGQVPAKAYEWFDHHVERSQQRFQLHKYAHGITEELQGSDVDLMSMFMDETAVTYKALSEFVRDECFILDDFVELISDKLVAKRFEALLTLQKLLAAGVLSQDNWDLFLDHLEHINYAAFWHLGIQAQKLCEADMLELPTPEVLCQYLEVDNSFDEAVIKAWFYQGDSEYAHDVLTSLLSFYFPTTSNH